MQTKWRYLPVIILALAGLSLIGYSLFDLFFPKDPVVEIIRADTQESPTPSVTTIVVDVSGAVENPGVYTIPLGSRVSDALVTAGGLTPSADKTYLSRHVNLASPVSDGSKIYILKKGEAPLTTSAVGEGGETVLGVSQPTLISINSASQSELEALWGIGEARAKSIVDHRPYTSLEEIKSRADVPDNVFDKIKAELTL
jgi:competence protein ComEA